MPRPKKTEEEKINVLVSRIQTYLKRNNLEHLELDGFDLKPNSKRKCPDGQVLKAVQQPDGSFKLKCVRV